MWEFSAACIKVVAMFHMSCMSFSGISGTWYRLRPANVQVNSWLCVCTASVVGGTRDRSGGGAAPNLAPGPPASSLSSAPAPGSTLPAAADVSAAVAAAAVPGGARGASPQVPGSSAPAAGSGASAGASAGSPGSGMLSNGGLPAGTQADPV